MGIPRTAKADRHSEEIKDQKIDIGNIPLNDFEYRIYIPFETLDDKFHNTASAVFHWFLK